MSLKVDFSYNEVLFSPPAPAVEIELHSPDSTTGSYAVRILALVDTGADGSVVPWSSIETLGLQLVDEVEVVGYDQRNFELQPVFSVYITIPPLKPILARVIPKESPSYAIIGRDVVNEWLLKLNGATLAGSIETDSKLSFT